MLIAELKQIYQEDFDRQFNSVSDSLPILRKKLDVQIGAKTHLLEPSQQAIIFAFLANRHIRDLEIYQGYSLFQKAQALLSKKPSYARMYYFQQVADAFAVLQRPDSAFFYAEKSLEIAHKLGNDSLVLNALGPLAQKAYDFKHYTKAIHYYKLILKHRLATDIIRRNINHSIAVIYARLHQYTQARAYYKKSLVYSEKMKDKFWIGLDNGNIGTTYFEEGNYEMALPYLLIDLKFSGYPEMTTSAMNCLNTLVQLSIYSQKITQAGYYLNKLQNSFQQIKLDTVSLNDQKLKFYETASMYYEAIKDYSTALKYTRNYTALHQEVDLTNAVKRARLEEAWLSFNQLSREIESKAREIRFQEQKILILEQEKKLQSAVGQIKSNLLMGAIVLILLIGGILYVTYDRYRSKKEAHRILEKQRDEISQKNRELSQSLHTVGLHQKRLENLAAHLSEVNATKDKLFSIIGHDLRAPIGNLKTLIELLSSQRINQEDFFQISESLNHHIEHVFFTLDNLLQWANTQLQGFQTAPQSVDLYEVAQENVDFLIGAAQSKEIVLYNHISRNSIANVDKNQISLVLRNLINNAIKFTPKCGKISLNAYLDEQKLKIAIADTGIGISEENIDKLFKRNIHYSTFGTAGEKGTGLGLLLCEEMISRNGGEISVNSIPGEGTTFWITLPRFLKIQN
ncbi:MAG: tetratricopeptide repeat-containing sensor histidine kinase [Microscillaceae bacterium]|nr:tetratricopeptide repeat-containing sensor histidine kinase [Microscillaceae bacterium]